MIRRPPHLPFWKHPNLIIVSDFFRFKRKVAIEFDRKQFTVKTIENRWELMQACMLRYGVFHKEFAGKRFPIGMDTDRYDSVADHLVIMDNRNRQIVGSYRLICSKFSQQFYTASEFELNGLLERPGVKLELSRACIRQDHRTGIVMSLLWRGLGAYMEAVGAQYLFGCSSVKVTHPSAIASVQHQLHEMGKWDESMDISPKANYRIPGYQRAVDSMAVADTHRTEIPGLLQAYLKAGATIAGEPALDRAFRCADFLTVLDRKRLSHAHEKKFVNGTDA